MKAADLSPDALLRGEAEIDSLPSDISTLLPAPDYAFSALNASGCLYTPVADRARLASGRTPPKWPNGKKFAVCLSHDVDHISRYALGASWRGFRLALAAAGSGKRDPVRLIAGVGKCLASALHRGRDPLHNFESWVDLESSYSSRSTFFFFPERVSTRHQSDCVYRYSDRLRFRGKKITVRRLIRELRDAGNEIGLHPSWHACENAAELRRQKAQLEDVLQKEIVSVRHHFLHFNPKTTPGAQEEAGFLYDSTVGFNRNIGFRYGTCWPFPLWDWRRQIASRVIEVPLCIQDGALFSSNAMALTYDAALNYVKGLFDVVEEVGGVLTLLWHPDAVAYDAKRWKLYETILAMSVSKGAWLATVSEIGEHCRIFAGLQSADGGSDESMHGTSRP